MNTSRLLPLVRRFSSSAAKNMKDSSLDVHPGYLKIKERQKHFQIDNGLRILEIDGPVDKAIYHLTGILIVVGFGTWLNNVYIMAFPQK
jgi:hypothetical protein